MLTKWYDYRVEKISGTAGYLGCYNSYLQSSWNFTTFIDQFDLPIHVKCHQGPRDVGNYASLETYTSRVAYQIEMFKFNGQNPSDKCVLYKKWQWQV